MNMYCIYDSSSARYFAPQIASDDYAAISRFISWLNSHPDRFKDFILYHVGFFDSSTGAVVSKESPDAVVFGFHYDFDKKEFINYEDLHSL